MGAPSLLPNQRQNCKCPETCLQSQRKFDLVVFPYFQCLKQKEFLFEQRKPNFLDPLHQTVSSK
jgi:hypothetical protein